MGSSLSKNLKSRKDTANLPSALGLPPQAKSPTTHEQVVEVLDTPVKDPRSQDDDFPFPLNDVDIHAVPEEKLLECFSTAPSVHDLGSVKIVRISKTLVIKGGEGVSPSEAETTIFAAQTFHLQVPKVYRKFSASITDPWGFDKQAHFFIMDYIPGPTIEDCWNSLSQDERESVALQVAKMIEDMQSKTLNEMSPGPIGAPSGRAFEGPWFTDYGAGPFATLQEIENWLNHKIDVCIRFEQIQPDTPRFKFCDLVFTHQDIAPRNLILDPQGKVWLVDWGCGGVYPRGFEQVAFREQCWNKDLHEMVLSRLSDKQEILTNQYYAIMYGLTTAALL